MPAAAAVILKLPSDYARFVQAAAGATRDVAMEDLIKENDNLCAQLKEVQQEVANGLVTITSQDGRLVYAEGSLASRKIDNWPISEGFSQTIKLSNSRAGRHGGKANPKLAMCKIQDLHNAVIWFTCFGSI